MREPIHIHAKAGRAPPSLFARLVNALAIQSYIPDPNDPRKLAFDFSHYEPDVDLDLVASYLVNVATCIFRIGGSYTVKDTMFPIFWLWAIRIKLIKDLYTYNWPGFPVSHHIRNFMDSVEKYCQGDLGNIIWVDAECHAGKTKREVSNHTHSYIQAIESETGKEVGIYSGQWFLEGYMEKQDWMLERKWWLAQWLTDQPREHPGPPYRPYGIPESNVLWHQTGSRCRASIFGGTGYVDSDRWELSDEEFNRIYRPESPLPPSPPPGSIQAELLRAEAEGLRRSADQIDYIADSISGG